MNTDTHLDRKRLYLNSIKLYVRTFYTLAVGLYNSRIVLEVLGVDDYGIYALVGSIVLMFSAFTSTMSSAMSRFMSYELASGSAESLRQTFGTALVIVSSIGALILLVGEVFGSFFLQDLSIPESSRGAAAIVYQFSLATVLVTVLQTCYLSSIISHENMGALAAFDMVSTTLKLAAIFILKYVGSEKLILYAALVFCVSMCVTVATVIYCRHHYPECRTGLIFGKDYFRAMLDYSGWNFFKTICDTLRPSGISVVVNLFFGVVVNAAIGIAVTVSSNLAKFTANVFLAFKPQIIKAYAMDAIGEMTSLLCDAIKFSLLVLSLLCVPLILEMDFVLHLWLGECPEYAVVFCRLLCVSMYFEVMIAIIEFGINATGKIHTFCLTNGLLTVSTVGIGWVAFRLGAPPQAIYVIQIVMGCLTALNDLYILHRLVPDLQMGKIIGGVSSVAVCAVILFAVCAWLHSLIGGEWLRFLIVGSADVAVLCLLGYAFILPKSMKRKIQAKLFRKSVG